MSLLGPFTFRLESWYNPFAPLSQAIGVNLLDTALLRLLTGNHAARIRTTIKVTANPLADQTEREKRIMRIWDSIIQMVVRLLPWIFAAPGMVGLLLSGFVILPFTETASHAKELQLMTGVSGYLYCLSNFLFDLVVYLAAFVPLAVCFVYLYSLETQSYVAVAAVVLAHSMVGVLLPHLIATFTATQAGAFALVLLPCTIGGAIQALVKLLLGSQWKGAVNWIVLFLPPGSLAIAVLKVVKLDAENKECLRMMSVDNSSKPEGCLGEIWQTFGYGLERCCEEIKSQSKHISLLGPFSPSHGGILFDLLAMLVMGACLFALISWKDSGRFLPSLPHVAKDDADGVIDSDVQAEKRLVDDLCSAKKFHEHSLVAHNVHKWYKSLHAVRGLNFAVAPSECFGLLGVNGAGKTTTFQVLTALLPMSQGDGYMEDWQSHIGYCLQYGGLLDKLNSYQLLYLFARLRGVPENKVKQLVDSMISVCDLQNHAHKKYGSYSGGNKRKLCMAVAYIGLPRVVFLDEPTAGVDVVARSKIFSALKAIRTASGNSLVLTSHSMDECELVCDRIGIMVAGQFKCLGTLQHLKGKFGRGYTLNVHLKSVSTLNVADFRAEVEKTFPGIELKSHREAVFDFHMEEKLPWSVLFAKIEELELMFSFEHVLVSECTLEQIFIGFAREQDKRELERDNAIGARPTR
ncbi:ATP-binding cassette sub-family A member 2-like [Ixodes scapularis]